MAATYHILNGDSLQQQWPSSIQGKQIVARSCLVEGPVKASSLQALFDIRASFIHQSYSDYSVADYYRMSVSSFSQIQNIPDKSEVCLWFEDDLFCQVNYWFALHLLLSSGNSYEMSLIRPQQHTQYGFGGLRKGDLETLYANKQSLGGFELWEQLWPLYQEESLKDLNRVGELLRPQYPFVFEAITTHIARLPTKNGIGRPKELLLKIKKELGTNQFGPIFKAFCERAPEYGFGDLQVKRLWEDLNNKS